MLDFSTSRLLDSTRRTHVYDAIRAAIAAIIYVAAVWAVARFFPGLPLLFLVALVGLEPFQHYRKTESWLR